MFWSEVSVKYIKQFILWCLFYAIFGFVLNWRKIRLTNLSTSTKNNEIYWCELSGGATPDNPVLAVARESRNIIARGKFPW